MVVANPVIVDDFLTDVGNEEAVVLGEVEGTDRLAAVSSKDSANLIVEVGHASSEHGVDRCNLIVRLVIDGGEGSADVQLAITDHERIHSRRRSGSEGRVEVAEVIELGETSAELTIDLGERTAEEQRVIAFIDDHVENRAVDGRVEVIDEVAGVDVVSEDVWPIHNRATSRCFDLLEISGHDDSVVELHRLPDSAIEDDRDITSRCFRDQSIVIDIACKCSPCGSRQYRQRQHHHDARCGCSHDEWPRKDVAGNITYCHVCESRSCSWRQPETKGARTSVTFRAERDSLVESLQLGASLLYN